MLDIRTSICCGGLRFKFESKSFIMFQSFDHRGLLSVHGINNFKTVFVVSYLFNKLERKLCPENKKSYSFGISIKRTSSMNQVERNVSDPEVVQKGVKTGNKFR